MPNRDKALKTGTVPAKAGRMVCLVYSILPQCIYPHLLSCICVFSLYCDACLKSSALRVGVKTLHNTMINAVLPSLFNLFVHRY